MKNDKIIITEYKLQELKSELSSLRKKKKELGKNLEQVRLSDISEDTDSVVAVTEEINNVAQRMSEIKETIDNAKVLDKKKCNVNKIQIGSVVDVESGGKKSQYTIVSDVESDPLSNKISDISPLGKALMKAKKEDIVSITIKGKKIEYKILDIC